MMPASKEKEKKKKEGTIWNHDPLSGYARL